ncbi:unnamed protein product, partial [Nesidiocoris tenuis]
MTIRNISMNEVLWFRRNCISQSINFFLVGERALILMLRVVCFKLKKKLSFQRSGRRAYRSDSRAVDKARWKISGLSKSAFLGVPYTNLLTGL